MWRKKWIKIKIKYGEIISEFRYVLEMIYRVMFFVRLRNR